MFTGIKARGTARYEGSHTIPYLVGTFFFSTRATSVEGKTNHQIPLYLQSTRFQSLALFRSVCDEDDRLDPTFWLVRFDGLWAARVAESGPRVH